MRVVISAGHGLYVRGASGPEPWGLDEVDEARRMMEQVATDLRSMGVEVTTYADDVSKTQNENLNRIVDFHNSQTRDLDVSLHFNAYEATAKPMGTEVLYVSQDELAEEVCLAISDAGDFISRGAKHRGDLFFLNNTEEPAILIETCFVDSEADAELYRQNFDLICEAIAEAISGEDVVPLPPDKPLFYARGSCSHFGGPEDMGVAPDEGLAFIYEVDEAPHLFLPYQPAGTTGLARRLNPWVHYIACRWDYSVTSKDMLRGGAMALVRAIRTGIELRAFPADWGPHEEKTGRAADLSPSLMQDLAITTDDEVEVTYPYLDEILV